MSLLSYTPLFSFPVFLFPPLISLPGFDLVWSSLFDISRASGLSCIACFRLFFHFHFFFTHTSFMSVFIVVFLLFMSTWNCKELHLVHFLLSVEFSMRLNIVEICNDTSGVLDILLVPLLKSLYLVY